MALLGRATYDPAAAATINIQSVQGMTAIDTTNLRIAFTVPASGQVFVNLRGTIVNSSGGTISMILYGVMDGSTVVKKVAPRQRYVGQVAASIFVTTIATFTVTGLTPAANLTWDAAVGVETGALGSALRYGGPNNTTGQDAFGAFCFEVWGVD